jgi:hypothetical protein
MFRKFTKQEINDSLVASFITPQQIQDLKDNFNLYCESLKEQKEKENLSNSNNNNERSQDKHPTHQQLDETIGKQ